MTSLRNPLDFSCVNCEAPIRGGVTFFVGLPFCCAGCVAGGPCTCSYDLDAPAASERHVPRLRLRSSAAFEVAEEPGVTEEPRAVPASRPDRDLVPVR